MSTSRRCEFAIPRSLTLTAGIARCILDHDHEGEHELDIPRITASPSDDATSDPLGNITT